MAENTIPCYGANIMRSETTYGLLVHWPPIKPMMTRQIIGQGRDVLRVNRRGSAAVHVRPIKLRATYCRIHNQIWHLSCSNNKQQIMI